MSCDLLADPFGALTTPFGGLLGSGDEAYPARPLPPPSSKNVGAQLDAVRGDPAKAKELVGNIAAALEGFEGTPEEKTKLQAAAVEAALEAVDIASILSPDSKVDLSGLLGGEGNVDDLLPSILGAAGKLAENASNVSDGLVAALAGADLKTIAEGEAGDMALTGLFLVLGAVDVNFDEIEGEEAMADLMTGLQGTFSGLLFDAENDGEPTEFGGALMTAYSGTLYDDQGRLAIDMETVPEDAKALVLAIELIHAANTAHSENGADLGLFGMVTEPLGGALSGLTTQIGDAGSPTIGDVLSALLGFPPSGI
jgi:hypothetical protein